MSDESLDTEQLEIERMKVAGDFSGLSNKVHELMRMPQSLCKVRGNCCKVATFKGTMSYDDLVALANSDSDDAPNARDFLTLFIPYETVDEVRQFAPGFVQRVEEAAYNDPDKTEFHPDRVGYFHCRFLAEDGRCLVHEDRPTGCRVYPFPHERTIYHPGCGFEKKGIENWRKIKDITDYFDRRLAELSGEIAAVEEATMDSAED